MPIAFATPRKLPFLLMASCLFWHGTSLAQTSPDVGATLTTQQAVKLRAMPPSQQLLFFVGEPGAEVAKLKEGEKLQVQEVKEVAVPFGKDIWVKGRTSKGETGWVYYGEKNKPVNFESKPTAKE